MAVDVANPVNRECPLNRQLSAWWANPYAANNVGGFFPEIVRGNAGFVINQFNPRWKPSEFALPTPISGNILNGSTQYTSCFCPQELTPSGTTFSAVITAYWPGANAFQTAFCSRRTETLAATAPLYMQHRQTTGLAVVLVSTAPTEFVLSLGNFNVAGYYMLGVSYNGASQGAIGYAMGPLWQGNKPTRTVATATLDAARRGFGNILLGNGEFNGLLGDYGITVFHSGRMWARALTVEDFDFAFRDEQDGYKETLNFLGRRRFYATTPGGTGPFPSTITVTSGDKVYDTNPYSPSVSVTGSSGAVTYTYYSAPDAGGSVIAAPTNVGSYSVIAHVAADADYEAADSPTKNFDITKANSSIVVTSGDVTYNASPYSATSTPTGSSGAITYTYYDGPDGTGSVIAAPTNAGSYSVIAHVAADANYNGASSVADNFTINKANSSITVTSGDKEFDGNPYSPTVSSSGSSGSVTYTYYDAPDGGGSVIAAPTDPGIYSVIAHLAADTNYNSADSPAKNFEITAGAQIAVFMNVVRHELQGGLR